MEFSLEDMDMSRFQQGATYEQIQAWVQEKYGFHVTHLNIAKTKRKCDIIERQNYDEGLCVQCLHIGPYDDEPTTVERMHRYMEKQGYTLDISDRRMHHEIYLSNARKTAPEKLKTVIRHPIRKG